MWGPEEERWMNGQSQDRGGVHGRSSVACGLTLGKAGVCSALPHAPGQQGR